MSRANLAFWLGCFVALLVVVPIGFAYEWFVVDPERRGLIAERAAAEDWLRAVLPAHEALTMRAAASQARGEALEATLRAFAPLDSSRLRAAVQWAPSTGQMSLLDVDRDYYRHLHAAGLRPQTTHEAR